MELSIFADEVFGKGEPDKLLDALPLIKEWGGNYVDFRGGYGKDYGGVETKTVDQIKSYKKRCDEVGLKVACVQASLGKVHMPGEERQNSEIKKLEWLIQVCEILQCKHMRSYNYWQPEELDKALMGTMLPGTEALNKAVNMFEPLAKKAQAAGLILSFENCGQSLDEVEAFLKVINIKGWGCAFDPKKGNLGDNVMPKTREESDDYIDRGMKMASMFHVKSTAILHETPSAFIFPWERMIAYAQKSGTVDYCTIEVSNTPSKSNLAQEEAAKRTHKAMQRSWIF